MATSMTKVAIQNLECPVCLRFFKDPKILSCSHSFCKGCLETLLESHPHQQNLMCPVCRGVTPVTDGDVGKLQANIALRSLVTDLETQGQLCANCDAQDKMQAVAFCKDCREYLCEACRTFHRNWSKFSGHSIVSASDILSGKIPLKRRYKCQKHPAEDEECFCFTCSMYVCFRCGVLEHTHRGHKIAEASVHEIEQKKSINDLTSEAANTKDVANQFISDVTKQRERLQEVGEKVMNGIDEAFENSVKTLVERKHALKSEVVKQISEVETVLSGMENETCEQITKVTSMCRLVENGRRIPLQKEALKVHNNLCQELGLVLDRFEPDNMGLRSVKEDCEKLYFERGKESHRVELGRVCTGKSKWVLVADKKLPMPDSMSGMAASPDNMISVGCHTGDIITYSADGQLQETVKTNYSICRLGYFCNGYYTVRHVNNAIILYTPQGHPLGTRFHTYLDNRGTYNSLTIDRRGLIIIGYTKYEKMQVFKPTGGPPIGEIPCHMFEPQQIFAMHSIQKIVVKSDSTIHVIDGLYGAPLCNIAKPGLRAFPAVCRDDSVMIAWVKHEQSLVSISLYTQGLEYKKTLVNEFRITTPNRVWYYLQQFNSGEIAFCTPDRLYIFKEIQT